MITKSVTALTVAQVKEAMANNAMVLDTRHSQEFARGFVPGAINVGLDGSFASWVGVLIKNMDQPMVLIVDQGREEEAMIRLARVGYESALGYLEGGIYSQASG